MFSILGMAMFYHGFWGFGWGAWGFFLFPFIFFLPFWGLRMLFWGSYWRHPMNRPMGPMGRWYGPSSYDHRYEKKSALDILDEAYAKGEISDEDYKVRKENLTK